MSSADDGSSASDRSWLSRSGKLLASAMLGLVMAILIIFRDAILPQVFRADVIGDKVREMRGDPAMQVVSVEAIQLSDENDTFARADSYRLNPSDERQIQDLFDHAAAPIIDQARNGSLRAPFATWRIYLRGGRNETVRILDIRPVNVKRDKPAAGTLFWIPPQGQDSARLMGVNMDSPDPQFRELTLGTPDGGTLGQSYFGSKTISLNDREDEVVVFRALSRHYSVSFDLAVDYQVGNERRREILTNNGQSFKFTAYNCSPVGLLEYAHFYALGSQSTFGLYPQNPNTMPHTLGFCG